MGFSRGMGVSREVPDVDRVAAYSDLIRISFELSLIYVVSTWLHESGKDYPIVRRCLDGRS